MDETPSATLDCPLCGGPVQPESPGLYKCQLDHHITHTTMVENANRNLSRALWQAISALESEAALLSESDMALSERAEEQAMLLRDFARYHAVQQAL